jgi:hypothetical protein
MNRPDRFWKSIDVLATAYFEGTLEKGTCSACAVGNLITAEGKEIPGVSDGNWHGRLLGFRGLNFPHDGDVAPELPYTDSEIHQIESAFEENATFDYDKGEVDSFPGLMAVVDVLIGIHEVEDENLRGQAKAAFEDQEYDTVDAVL